MYLLRHGISEFNAHFAQTGRDPGIIDAPLTTRGQEQAKGAAKHFLNLKHNPQRLKAPSRILCSPYSRAIQTALPIAESLGLPLAALPLLGERRLYSCDTGTACATLKTRYPAVDFSAVENESWWPAAHEGDEDIARRVQAFAAIETLQREKDLGEILVVSHWYFIFTLSSLDCDNCQIVWRDGAGTFHRQ